MTRLTADPVSNRPRRASGSRPSAMTGRPKAPPDSGDVSDRVSTEVACQPCDVPQDLSTLSCVSAQTTRVESSNASQSRGHLNERAHVLLQDGIAPTSP